MILSQYTSVLLMRGIKLQKELAQSARLSHPISDGSIHNLSARGGDHGLTLEELRDEVGPINIT